MQWRLWWLSRVKTEITPLTNVTVDNPPPIFLYHEPEVDECNGDDRNKIFTHLGKTCNKHLITKIICPWGFKKFNQRYSIKFCMYNLYLI